MPARRVLVECVVLSLHDACVYYPCCKGCLSRMDVEQQDTTRSRCSRCGSSCAREQVDHRYRLSLRVARDRSIFGVTVFGNCLNPFFGIHASGLYRLVGSLDKASTRNTLLVKAVQDCFIGRHFIFGIKVPETGSLPWLELPVGSKEPVHFIASQMILPKATVQRGFSVLTYYQVLVQKAAQCETKLADPKRDSRPCVKTLNSFNNATLSLSGLLSPQSSQSQDSLIPTPPWQQSLGLITSSAEQDEDGSNNNNKTPIHVQKGCVENFKVTEEGSLSPLLPLELTTLLSPCSKSAQNVPNSRTWTNPAVDSFSTRQLETKTFLSSSSAWDDLPFSESLTEFLNKDSDDVEEQRNVQKETENLEIKNTSTSTHSRIFLDVTNTPAANRHDLSDQDEQLEDDSYNCSADLFSSSLKDQLKNTTQQSSLLSKQKPSGENDKYSTPEQQNKPKRRKRKSLISTQSLDFVPPSQSTPIVKVRDLKADSQDSGVFYGNLPEFEHKETSRIGFSSSNSNRVGSTKENADRRKSSRHKSTPEHTTTVPKRTVNGGSALRISRFDDCDVTFNEMVVPQTPAAGPGLSVKLRRKLLSSSDLNCSAQTVKTNREVADGSLDGGYNENEACDWSRDLFSDSL